MAETSKGSPRLEWPPARAMKRLALLFLVVQVGLPLAGALAFHEWAGASTRAALLARTGDPWVGSWLGGFLQRDGGHYLGIAMDGYTSPASWAFFPLYPFTARALGPVFGGVARAGLAISFAASLVSCAAIYATAAASQGRETAARAVALFLAFPTHFFFAAFYSEALFFAFVALALLCYSRDRWALAAGFGALAAAARSSGILLVPALAIGSLNRGQWRVIDRRLAWLAVIPVGTALFFLAGFLETGKVAAPLSAQDFWARKTTFPLLTIAQAAQDLRLDPLDLQRGVDCLAVFGAFALAARSIRRLDAAESTLILFAILMPLSSGLVLSMARFIAALPPIYGLLARELDGPKRFGGAIAASILVQLALTIEFATGSGIV